MDEIDAALVLFAQPNTTAGLPDEEDMWDFLPPIKRPQSNLIVDDDSNPSVANIFAFGAFADKHDGVVYHKLTGSFPFMSLEGSVCFFPVSL